MDGQLLGGHACRPVVGHVRAPLLEVLGEAGDVVDGGRGVEQAAPAAAPPPGFGHPAGHGDVVGMKGHPVGTEGQDRVRLDLGEQLADHGAGPGRRARQGRRQAARECGARRPRRRPSPPRPPTGGFAPAEPGATSRDRTCRARRRWPTRRRPAARGRWPRPSLRRRGRSRRRDGPRRTGSCRARRSACSWSLRPASPSPSFGLPARWEPMRARCESAPPWSPA